MATDKEFLGYVLEQLSGLGDISHRAMMGEYVIYYKGTVIGGIYDNRFLLKPTKLAKQLVPDAPMELPYESAKEMISADIDDRERTYELIKAVYSDLGANKKRTK